MNNYLILILIQNVHQNDVYWHNNTPLFILVHKNNITTDQWHNNTSNIVVLKYPWFICLSSYIITVTSKDVQKETSFSGPFPSLDCTLPKVCLATLPDIQDGFWLAEKLEILKIIRTTGWNETKFGPNSLWFFCKIIYSGLVIYPRWLIIQLLIFLY